MKLNISQSRIVGLIYIILITMLIALLFDNTANATDRDGEQRQDQSQDQDQQQYQDQWQSQDQQNEQNATVNNTSETKVFAAGASSGDSNALCQQVRDIRVADGFLFGLRFDLTHEDCLRLQMADGAYSRGQDDFGNTLTCTTKIAREVYPSVVECKDSLEQTSIVKALQERIATLEAQKASALAERNADNVACEKSKNIIASTCKADK